MRSVHEQDVDVKKVIRLLTCTLTTDNLDPAVIFAKSRGVRSCTPPLGPASAGKEVEAKLRRIKVPEPRGSS